jgi:glutathione S-transferase
MFPRSVKFHRLCNIAGLEVKTVHMTLPDQGPSFDDELTIRMQHLPFLEANGKRYSSARAIIDYFLSFIDKEETRTQLVPLDSNFNPILRQWASETFAASLLYCRWKIEPNFRRFIAGVNWGREVEEESIHALQMKVLGALRGSPIGQLDYQAYKEVLREQLRSLEALLGDQQFFEPAAKFPGLTDLHVFMVLQGFLSKDIEESEAIRRKYPTLVEWHDRVDAATQGREVSDAVTVNDFTLPKKFFSPG